MSLGHVGHKQLLLVLVLSCLAPSVHSWWDENCAENGQCSRMFKSYESLIKGEGCRSFYITGKCSRICTYSLKSLIGRHTWSKCAERCEWSKAVTDGASSWLDMCLANPAPDVFESEETEHVDNGSAKWKPQSGTGGDSLEPGKSRYALVHWIVLGSILVLTVVTIAAVATRPSLKGSLDNNMRRAISWVRTLRGKQRYVRTTTGKAPLDIGPDRKELRNLQRGARRHLKAMRATLD